MQDIRFGAARTRSGGPSRRAASEGRTPGHDQGSGPDASLLAYRLCPVCQRAVPITSSEQYCVNDGTPLLEACPGCKAAIASPYSRYCAGCGRALTAPASTPQD